MARVTSMSRLKYKQQCSGPQPWQPLSYVKQSTTHWHTPQPPSPAHTNTDTYTAAPTSTEPHCRHLLNTSTSTRVTHAWMPPAPHQQPHQHLPPHLHDQLVCTCNEVQSVCVVVLLRDVLPKSESSAPGGDAPPGPLVGVGPHQVAHGTLVGHLHNPMERGEGGGGGGEGEGEEDSRVGQHHQHKKSDGADNARWTAGCP